MTSPGSLFSEMLFLLAGAVIAAPIFRRLGLGTVLGYLAAGVVIGPILQRVTDTEEVLHVAEFGVVFLLFVIGLELKPSRLWQMRGDVFGLGPAQVLLTGGAIAGLAFWVGMADWRGSLVIGFGLALSSTAFALQLLNDAGEMNSRYGQRSFSVLLFQDLAIVPLLALITVLAPGTEEQAATPLVDFGVAVAAVAAVVVAGKYLLNPMFQIIAKAGAREVMIAAALLVVLGAAAAMQAVGLSMAMGSFLAGVMLAESSYRHELEADIEPFRGLLLALFFVAVGLSLEVGVIVENILFIVPAVLVFMALKTLVVYVLCRLWGSSHNDAIQIASLLPQGGEFAFVLFTAASAAGLLPSSTASLLIAIVTLSMALTPLGAALARRFLDGETREELEEDFEGAGADVMMIGFSRFGQIAAQILLAGGSSVTVIDDSADRIRQAANFGFRIYFGDGTRKDVLIASGIERAKIVVVCTQKRETTNRIVELIRSEFPMVRVFARSYDRVHSLHLRQQGIEYELRETLESGLLFGRKTLEALGMSESAAEDIGNDIRRRDEERLEIQAVQGLGAGGALLFNEPVRPEPLIKPKRANMEPVEEEAEPGVSVGKW
jgi:CPA2 family monovalent cation:H+ antiporter-2